MDEVYAKRKKKYNITQWNEYKVNFWGIPKSMNTSIKMALLNGINLLPEGFKKYNNIQTANALQSIHSMEQERYITPRIANRNGNLNFTVIRDPIERICSLYKDLVLERNHLVIDQISLNADMSFFEFCQQLLSTNDRNCNIHFKSQHGILKKAKNLNVFTVNNISIFLNEIGCSNLPHVNKSKSENVLIEHRDEEIIKKRYRKDFNLQYNV